MDRCAREIVNGRVGKGISALLLLALLLVQAGCHWGGRGGTPPPPGSEEVTGDNTAPPPCRSGFRPPWRRAGRGSRPAPRRRSTTPRSAPRGRAVMARSPPRRARHRRRRGGPTPLHGPTTPRDPYRRLPPANRNRPPRRGGGTRAEGQARSACSGLGEVPRGTGLPGRFHRHHHGVRPLSIRREGFHRGKTDVPLERARVDVGGPLLHLPDQRHDRLLSRHGDARADPTGVHAYGEGERRRGPLQPGYREDHVPVPADGDDPEGGRHGPFRLRPGERRLLFPMAGPGRRGPSTEHVWGSKGVSDLLARSRERADPHGTRGGGHDRGPSDHPQGREARQQGGP